MKIAHKYFHFHKENVITLIWVFLLKKNMEKGGLQKQVEIIVHFIEIIENALIAIIIQIEFITSFIKIFKEIFFIKFFISFQVVF